LHSDQTHKNQRSDKQATPYFHPAFHSFPEICGSPDYSGVKMTFFVLLLSTASVLASEGPWTTPTSVHNLYLGLFREQFRCFEAMGKESSECGSGLPVPSAVQQAGIKIFYRYGIDRNWDFAVAAPFGKSQMAEPSGQPVQAPTTGVGLVESRIRRRLGSTGPMDWSASAGVRSGALHRETRGRITNLGEGTTDFAGTVSTGSTGLLGPRFYTASWDATYYYRLPLQVDDELGGIPGDELRLSSVFDYAFSSRMGLGVSVDGFHRLTGAELDFGKIAEYGDDRWAALAASQVKVGGRIMMYPQGAMPYLQLGAQRVVWAKNNPTDSLFIEVAMGRDFGSRKP
jgi:hypothetical protein